jgi:hypothetical protein
MNRIFFVGLILAAPVMAQTGGTFVLSPSLIAGGGGGSAGGDLAARASIGQPATVSSSGGPFDLRSGFWPQLMVGQPPTPSATPTISPTPPAATPPTAASATPTPTGPPSDTPTTTVALATATPSPTMTQSLAPSSPTVSPTPTSTATPDCIGDCGGDGAVTVDEIVLMVNIALGGEGLEGCLSADSDGDGGVSVDEIILAVNNALDGCLRLETGI